MEQGSYVERGVYQGTCNITSAIPSGRYSNKNSVSENGVVDNLIYMGDNDKLIKELTREKYELGVIQYWNFSCVNQDVMS
jgi:hypothetical protein